MPLKTRFRAFKPKSAAIPSESAVLFIWRKNRFAPRLHQKEHALTLSARHLTNAAPSPILR